VPQFSQPSVSPPPNTPSGRRLAFDPSPPALLLINSGFSQCCFNALTTCGITSTWTFFPQRTLKCSYPFKHRIDSWCSRSSCAHGASHQYQQMNQRHRRESRRSSQYFMLGNSLNKIPTGGDIRWNRCTTDFMLANK